MSSSTGPTRRSSVAATLADQNFEGKTKEYFPQNAESIVEEEPKKKTNLFVVFSGLQLSLFLAALDR